MWFCRVCGVSLMLTSKGKNMTKWQDKTGEERREEIRKLLVVFAEEGGATPTEEQLAEATDRIMKNMVDSPMYEMVDISSRSGK